MVHLDDGPIVLLVEPASGVELDESLRARIRSELRTQLSPRHTPDEIYSISSIPRTHTGKKLEVPVKRILEGTPADEVVSRGALQDPSAAEMVEELACNRRARLSR